jgi:hypothetical protein
MVATVSKNQINLTINAGSSSQDHTPKSSRDPTLLITGKETNSGGDPGATQRHASTKNASRRELDVKGILEILGKWEKQRRSRARDREHRERERERERRNRDARKPNPLGVAFRAPTKP